ncbi:hypothetical protein [Sulfitobacter sp. SK012]|uniref:hypothetical protein n=1 Tax=Sulfitobacter sp. SK012 TaxID=1389005 RepID=UPI003F8FD907
MAPAETLLCLFNFTEDWQNLPSHWLRELGVADFHGAMSDGALDLNDDTFTLPPLGRVWLTQPEAHERYERYE